MEYFRSTLATTAVLILGLLGAAHVLNPRDQAPVGVASAVAAPAAATAWVDPPGARVAEAPASRPATFTLLPAELTARLPVAEIAQPGPGRTRRAEASRRSRAARLDHRPDPASATVAATAIGPTAQASSGAPSSAQSAKGDPIGDLLRDLGIGRDGEG